MSRGDDIAAARAMGADLAYMGTRFLATDEAQVDERYKQMIIDSQSSDIVWVILIFILYCIWCSLACFLSCSCLFFCYFEKKVTRKESVVWTPTFLRHRFLPLAWIRTISRNASTISILAKSSIRPRRGKTFGAQVSWFWDSFALLLRLSALVVLLFVFFLSFWSLLSFAFALSFINSSSHMIITVTMQARVSAHG